MAAGTMIELAGLTDNIDTSDQLEIFEAYQKVFIINGTILKVADFVNTKLTLALFTTAPTRGSTIIQDTSDATMIVDFVNTGLTEIYGYVTGGTFNTTNTISGGDLASSNSLVPAGINGMLTHAALTTAHAADDVLTQATTSATMTVEYTDATKTHTYGRITAGTFNTTKAVTGSGSGTGFTPTATDTSPPLAYDYTVYPGGTFGTMPGQAYLGCMYRGRIVLSGNPEAPNQWYMSRQANPYDFAYVSNDSQSPVAGGEDPTGAGKVGDIVRCLIAYKDDFLIYGCANSIQEMAGDPASGGSIDTIDATTGIFGAHSWCFDGDGNLYFWGAGGIYVLERSSRNVRNLTEISLPDLIKDEAADPSTHRITMEYDRKRFGLNICITKLADGSNSNYFYSLSELTMGLFPETYPEECGAYSMFYYDANDPDYKDLLVGCKDGYIRKFDPTAKDDNIGATTEAINSYVTFGPLKLASEGKEGMLHSLSGFVTGGGSGGTEADSNDIAYKIFVGRNAGDVAEKLVANSGQKISGTLKATGLPRGQTQKKKVRGVFAGIRLENITAGQTMSIDRLVVNTVQKGRIK